MNKKNTITRRKVIGGIGAGLAAMAINPVFAAPASPSRRLLHRS